MKMTKVLLFGVAVAASVATQTARGDNLAAAAASASASVNRLVLGSPHSLEEFPWLVRGHSQPPGAAGPAQNVRAYPNNLAAVAARASALVNRPVLASPHELEAFPSLLQGYSPPTGAGEPAQDTESYPDNLAALAAKASELVNRPVAASPHALEGFPGLMRGAAEPSTESPIQLAPLK